MEAEAVQSGRWERLGGGGGCESRLAAGLCVVRRGRGQIVCMAFGGAGSLTY